MKTFLLSLASPYVLQKYEDCGQFAPVKLLANRPGEETHSVKRLSFMAAEFHHANRQRKAMLAALDRLPNPQDRINFLLDKELMEEAAPIMRAEGDYFICVDKFKRLNLFSRKCL